MQIKGIFFDLGGTLFSYGGRIGGGGIAHVVNALALDAPGEEIGRTWRAASREVGAEYGRQRYFLHKDLFLDKGGFTATHRSRFEIRDTRHPAPGTPWSSLISDLASGIRGVGGSVEVMTGDGGVRMHGFEASRPHRDGAVLLP